MGDSFGKVFKITTFGESHGKAVGVTIQGCPAGLEISEKDIQFELDRRKPGQNEITTQRKEGDIAQIQSGIFEGKTTGTAIHIVVQNNDHRSKDYGNIQNVYRPSHADYTYDAKFGHRDYRGGGRASARETISRVAAGAIAKKLLMQLAGTETVGWVEQIHDISANTPLEEINLLTHEKVDTNMVRCPNQEVAKSMVTRIKQIKKKGDSVGGIIFVIIKNKVTGLGEPVFDKLNAELAKAIMSIPAARAIEFGLGFSSVLLTGSQHNDAFYVKNGEVHTKTNNSGGIQGGISNGENIFLKVAFKPTATIHIKQQSVTSDIKDTEFIAKGRHDPCVLPRAVPIVEAMINLCLVDHYLRNKLSQVDKINQS